MISNAGGGGSGDSWFNGWKMGRLDRGWRQGCNETQHTHKHNRVVHHEPVFAFGGAHKAAETRGKPDRHRSATHGILTGAAVWEGTTLRKPPRPHCRAKGLDAGWVSYKQTQQNNKTKHNKTNKKKENADFLFEIFVIVPFSNIRPPKIIAGFWNMNCYQK